MQERDEYLRLEIERLHRQVRKLKIGGVLALLSAAVVVLTAAVTPQDTMSAKTFFILDENGAPRGNFGVLSNGDAGMAFTDPAGTVRIGMRVTPDGTPRLNLFDPDQNSRAEFTMDIEGAPQLIFNDAGGNGRIALSVSPEGAAQIIFLGPDGSTRRGVVGTLEDGRPIIVLSDASGSPVFQAPQ